MTKGTLADLHKSAEGDCTFDWCQPARDEMQVPSAKGQYAKTTPVYWISSLRYTNKPKSLELVRAMIGRMAEHTDDPRFAQAAAGENLEAFSAWYTANKKPGIGTTIVALGRAVEYLLGRDGPEYENSLHLNSFVTTWISAMNNLTGVEEAQVTEDLGPWLRAQVTEAEFCNGYD